MRKFTLLFSALLLGTLASNAQSVATFEDLSLSKPDTFYVNYTASGTDVGFNEADVHFPCVYDTSYGGYWVNGFSYSNMTDSVTSGIANQYAAKADTGYNSAKYAVAYGTTNTISLLDTADLSPAIGMYVTNNTYAANSMRYGDAFARRFGYTPTDTTGSYPDWFKLTIHGYRHGAELPDSVDFYLADYRFADNDSDYIVNTWKYVDLSSLGDVDTYEFDLSSSDTGAFGMNTPAYFCIDNFSFNTTTAVHNVAAPVAKVYPNPATNMLYVDLSDNSVQQVSVMSVSGSTINTYAVTGKQLAINTASLPSGMYFLQLSGNNKNATVRFVKQ